MPAPLRLVDYDPAWPRRYAAERARIVQAIGAHVLDIQHVGSTSVPGLGGKPVLDITIALPDEAAADACIEPMISLGYEYRGPYGDDPRRRYYVRDDTEGKRFAHVHMYVMPARAFDELIAFRDALRADDALATAYMAEKRRLADEVGWVKEAYTMAKAPWVHGVLTELRRTGRLRP